MPEVAENRKGAAEIKVDKIMTNKNNAKFRYDWRTEFTGLLA